MIQGISSSSSNIVIICADLTFHTNISSGSLDSLLCQLFSRDLYVFPLSQPPTSVTIPQALSGLKSEILKLNLLLPGKNFVYFSLYYSFTTKTYTFGLIMMSRFLDHLISFFFSTSSWFQPGLHIPITVPTNTTQSEL